MKQQYNDCNIARQPTNIRKYNHVDIEPRQKDWSGIGNFMIRLDTSSRTYTNRCRLHLLGSPVRSWHTKRTLIEPLRKSLNAYQ